MTCFPDQRGRFLNDMACFTVGRRRLLNDIACFTLSHGRLLNDMAGIPMCRRRFLNDMAGFTRGRTRFLNAFAGFFRRQGLCRLRFEDILVVRPQKPLVSAVVRRGALNVPLDFIPIARVDIDVRRAIRSL